MYFLKNVALLHLVFRFAEKPIQMRGINQIKFSLTVTTEPIILWNIGLLWKLLFLFREDTYCSAFTVSNRSHPPEVGAGSSFVAFAAQDRSWGHYIHDIWTRIAWTSPLSTPCSLSPRVSFGLYLSCHPFPPLEFLSSSVPLSVGFYLGKGENWSQTDTKARIFRCARGQSWYLLAGRIVENGGKVSHHGDGMEMVGKVVVGGDAWTRLPLGTVSGGVVGSQPWDWGVEGFKDDSGRGYWIELCFKDVSFSMADW